MKKQMVAFVVSSLIASSLAGCEAKTDKDSISTENVITPAATVTPAAKEDVAAIYKDGTYTTQTDPDYEGFYEKATIEVDNGLITSVDWGIYDSTRNDKPFDENYEEVYTGQDEYVEQCRSDWKGSRSYAADLIATQDVTKVDAVSGATWTNKLFKGVVNKALEDAALE
ncbi:MAG TPA: FMN-binding protein [Mobilitalea sp.]|nr:FMN-binding protein [Mobilitalea sp.]